MTYNFDPDRWYERELAFLTHKLNSGTLTEKEFEQSVSDLYLRYDEMVDRLDGTYCIPSK